MVHRNMFVVPALAGTLPFRLKAAIQTAYGKFLKFSFQARKQDGLLGPSWPVG